MKLLEFKKKGKFSDTQLGLVFGVVRQTISKWLVDESLIPLWVIKHLEFVDGK